MVCSCVTNVYCVIFISNEHVFPGGQGADMWMHYLCNLCFCLVRRTNFMTPSSPQPSGLIIPPQTGDTLLNAPQNINCIRNLCSRTVRRCVLSLQQNVCLHLKDLDSEKQPWWVSSLNVCTLTGTLDITVWLKSIMPCCIFTRDDLKTTTLTRTSST